jgi:RHS repeat-associated protein
MPFEFDEFRVCSRSIHAGQSMVFTYGPANQMATMTTSGVTSSFSYDPWGRLASRSATIGGQSYTATYTYRWGDKLQRIDSDFPGETPVVQYNYDGLGKRRLKAVGNDTTYWRWDAGYAVLAQYGDSSPDWNISGFDRFFVPFGHTALAEADLDASGVPANAAYTYLAHDHLGTSTHGFDQSKTVVSQNVHLPFGQRTYASGNSPYHEFTGKPWDAEAQLYYFPYRYYSPNMNRWTMPDPLGLVDGPNVYAYVGGKPTSRFDRLGLQIYSCRGCRGKTVVRCDKPGRYTSFCSGLDPIDTAACESAIDDLCKEIKYRRNCCMADFSHCSVCNEPCILQCLENFNICLGSGYATIPDRLKPKN